MRLTPWLAAAVLSILSPAVRVNVPTGRKESIAKHVVCVPCNDAALGLMRRRHLQATMLVQDVATGSVIVFASSEPRSLDVTSQVLPLSLSKLFLAASWWDQKQPDWRFRSHGSPNDPNPAFREMVNVHEILVGGSDSAAEQMAVALRRAVGTKAVLNDLHRYGFNRNHETDWLYIDPEWQSRFKAKPSSADLTGLTDQQWGAALSIGETFMRTTPLQISEFLQAVGNNGIFCAASATKITDPPTQAHQAQTCSRPRRTVTQETARLLRSAMIDTVKRGTAQRISPALDSTGWSIGGKTGTGGSVGVPLTEMDGWFAGLIFDSHGKARFTVATFVRQGGPGGGNAAEVSAGIARFLATNAAQKASLSQRRSPTT